MRLHLGRGADSGHAGHAQGRLEAARGSGSRGALKLAILLAGGALILSAEPAAGQLPGWEPSLSAGVLRVDDELSVEVPDQWAAVLGGRFGVRLSPEAMIGFDLWAAPLDGPAAGTLWGAGPHLVLAPFAERTWAFDPQLEFGIEAIRLDDEEDRSVAFVFGAGLRRRWGPRWSAAIGLRNRFLSIEEEAIEGVATGRDSELWEFGVQIAFTPDGHGG